MESFYNPAGGFHILSVITYIPLVGVLILEEDEPALIALVPAD
mgnify:CR=1 FL=1